jgi:hypothetical protein
MRFMKKLALGVAFASSVLVLFVRADSTPLPMVEADVLPLALSDDFQFRKFEIFRNALPRPGATPIPTRELMIDFERKRRVWGAIDGVDFNQRTGQYFTFCWRTKRPANLTLRLEYRQTELKNYVQGRELYYPNARGSHTSEFSVVGNDYRDDGPILCWRAILIENNRIVALLQSRTWR